MTIVSKVSLALALISESALPDFSHFEFAKIRFLSHPHNLSFIFDCKSTTITRSLFALCLFFISVLPSINGELPQPHDYNGHSDEAIIFCASLNFS